MFVFVDYKQKKYNVYSDVDSLKAIQPLNCARINVIVTQRLCCI